VHVDVDLAVGGRVVLLQERPELHDPGVVDEDVQWAEVRLDRVEERLEGAAVGDVERVGLDGRAELGGGGLRGGEVQVADGDFHALGDERARRLLADAAGTAGDRYDLTAEDAGLLGHGALLLGGTNVTLASTVAGSGPFC